MFIQLILVYVLLPLYESRTIFFRLAFPMFEYEQVVVFCSVLTVTGMLDQTNHKLIEKHRYVAVAVQ